MSRPALFIAREPDETLRTFLPVIAELRRRGRDCQVIFHHQPSPWALAELAKLGAPTRRVALPERKLAGRLASLGELWQLRQTRRLAGQLLNAIDPAAVVVIQDTLLLERFLVREANRRGRGTLVVQWAFTYPQSMYDRLAAIKRGAAPVSASAVVGTAAHRLRPYALAQRLLGVRFNLVNSYGGGEADAFAVMGAAFRDQFLGQGVRKERVEITGHPLHDAAFTQRQDLTPARMAALKRSYGLPEQARIVLYATQPVLWRAVITREQLIENVQALARAVAALGPEWLLVLKLHPRESMADYQPALADDLPLRLIDRGQIAELIAPAEVFISSSSSTVLTAMMLDKPIVTVNFNEVPHFDYFESVGGTLHVRTPAAAAETLRQAAFDSEARERLAGERASILGRYARFDGQATGRLADLVEELAGWT